MNDLEKQHHFNLMSEAIKNIEEGIKQKNIDIVENGGDILFGRISDYRDALKAEKIDI